MLRRLHRIAGTIHAAAIGHFRWRRAGPDAARLADRDPARLPRPDPGAARAHRDRAGARRIARRFRRLHASDQGAAPARRRRLVRSARAARQSARGPHPALDQAAGCAAVGRRLAARAAARVRPRAASLGRADQPGPARARPGGDRLGRSARARSRFAAARLPGPVDPADRARLHERRPPRPPQPAPSARGDPDRSDRAPGRDPRRIAGRRCSPAPSPASASGSAPRR